MARHNVIVIKLDDYPYTAWAKMSHLDNRTDFVKFTRSYFNYSLCGVSRVTMYNGQHQHRHGVYWHGTSAADESSPLRLWDGLHVNTNSLLRWLKSAGYTTALFGKYLNFAPFNRGDFYSPAGLDETRIALDDVALGTGHSGHTGLDYGGTGGPYVLNVNGVYQFKGADDTWTVAPVVGYTPEARANRSGSTDYSTDYFNHRIQLWIETARQPWYLDVGLRASHQPIAPAARHGSVFFAPQRSNSFNEVDISDKPTWLRQTVPNQFNSTAAANLDAVQVSVFRAALAVDEMIYDLIAKLSELGQLENTVIMVVADNGLILGDHRLSTDVGSAKNVPYEASMRTRIYVRYPGVAGRTDSTALVSNIDIVPTIMDVAKGTFTQRPDGMSLLPVIDGRVPSSNFRTQMLIEFVNNPGNDGLPTFKGVVTNDGQKYMEWDSLVFGGPPAINSPAEKEYYDLNTDPDELTNSYDSLSAAAKTDLAQRLAAMKAG